MRRTTVRTVPQLLLAAGLLGLGTGCSTGPLADFMDFVHPSDVRKGDLAGRAPAPVGEAPASRPGMGNDGLPPRIPEITPLKFEDSAPPTITPPSTRPGGL